MQTNNLEQQGQQWQKRETSNQKVSGLLNTGFIVLPEVKKEVEVAMEVKK